MKAICEEQQRICVFLYVAFDPIYSTYCISNMIDYLSIYIHRKIKTCKRCIKNRTIG